MKRRQDFDRHDNTLQNRHVTCTLQAQSCCSDRTARREVYIILARELHVHIRIQTAKPSVPQLILCHKSRQSSMQIQRGRKVCSYTGLSPVRVPPLPTAFLALPKTGRRGFAFFQRSHPTQLLIRLPFDCDATRVVLLLSLCGSSPHSSRVLCSRFSLPTLKVWRRHRCQITTVISVTGKDNAQYIQN